jgi:N-succinyldiaminopimelate aminotransferase
MTRSDRAERRGSASTAGLRVVPGSYLAQPAADSSNPGAGYIRLAPVDDLATTKEALTRLATRTG